jgi:hypothetical protein
MTMVLEFIQKLVISIPFSGRNLFWIEKLLDETLLPNKSPLPRGWLKAEGLKSINQWQNFSLIKKKFWIASFLAMTMTLKIIKKPVISTKVEKSLEI